MENQLFGEYPCKVDAKGRVRIPSALLKQMQALGSDQFVVNRGFKKYLILYPKNVWDKLSSQVNDLNHFVEKNRQFKRIFNAGATLMELGGSDRINLPSRLLKYANIESEAILSTNGEYVEIWNPDVFDAMMDDEMMDASVLGEEVLGDRNHPAVVHVVGSRPDAS